MYIWLGIDLDEQLSPLREAIAEVESIIPPRHSGLTLPLHISIKISFSVPATLVEEVKACVLDIYRGITPFLIETAGIQREGGIVWLRYQPHPTLVALQEGLGKTLLSRFGIPLHPYDLDFKFHTTLYMEGGADGEEKCQRAYELLKHTPYPARVVASRFCIGVSDDGSLGTYSVAETVWHESNF